MKVRLITALFCVVLCFSLVLTGCDTGTNTSGTTSGSSVSTDPSATGIVDGYNHDTGRYQSLNEVIDWGGRELKILVLGPEHPTYYSEDFTYDPDIVGNVINDAAFDRNDLLETKYNVTISVIQAGFGEIVPLIQSDVNTGTKYYDIVMPYVRNAAALAVNGDLLDLTAYDSIDLSKPWWDQNFVEAITLKGSLFFATGDIGLLNKVCANSVIFNKQMISDNELENPYELVESKQWTIDKMAEMGRAVLRDDGDGVLQYEGTDVFGLSTSYGDAINYYIGAGQNLCLKDANDEPIISIGNTETVAIAQKIITFLSEDACIHAQNMGTNMWDKSLAIFSDGRALFRTSAFSANRKLRDTAIVFGIVPLPLYTPEQENYYSFVATNGTVACAAISSGCADEEFSAYMIEAAAVEGKNILTPAYIDLALTQRDTRDDESQEMLEIIFNNLRYDINHVFNFGLSNILQTLVQNKAPDQIISSIDANRSAVEQSISDTMEAFDKFSS